MTDGDKGLRGKRGADGDKGPPGRIGSRRRPPLIEFVAFILLVIAIGWGLHYEQQQSMAACARSKQGYVVLHKMADTLSKKTVLQPGVTDPDVIAQHAEASRLKDENKKELEAALANPPRCDS